MRRLFTFGCSFTDYIWPTWSNLVGPYFDVYENWAKISQGNTFIMQRIVECDIQHCFTENDTVVVAWSTHLRMDTMVDWCWQSHVHRVNAQINPSWDKSYCYYNSLSAIRLAEEYLKSKQTNYFMTSIKPLDIDETELAENNKVKSLWETHPQLLPYRINRNDRWLNTFDGDTFPLTSPSNEKYKMFLDDPTIKVLHEKLGLPYDGVFVDNHPTPIMHYKWLETSGLLDRLNITDRKEMQKKAKAYTNTLMKTERFDAVKETFSQTRRTTPGLVCSRLY